MDKSLVIRYKEFASATELEGCDRELLAQAFQAAEGAYAPYSQFHVGAALRLKDGSVVCGNTLCRADGTLRSLGSKAGTT